MSDSVPPHGPQPTRLLVHGILQARTLEWVAISSSNAWKWKVKVKSLSRVRLLATPWTAAYQAPPSMGFSRQEYWSGSQCPSPGDLPNAGMNQGLLHCRKILTIWATRKASRFSPKSLFIWLNGVLVATEGSSLWCESFSSCPEAYEILVHQPGIQPAFPTQEGRFFTPEGTN